MRILSDLGVSAYLYRRVGKDSDTGYSKEVANYQYIGTILVYMHPLNTNRSPDVSNEVGVTTVMQQLGITSAPLALQDEIRFEGKVYRVVRIDTMYSGKTEFVAERKV